MARITKKTAIPVRPPEPVDIQAIAGVERLTDRWPLGSEWTPARAAAALKSVHESPEDYLRLAEDVLERYAHLGSVMQTRTLAVVGRDIEVQSGDGSAAGQKIADEYRETIVESEAWHEAMCDLMSAVYYSFAVLQPIWDCTTRPWTYRAFSWQDPKLFRFDRVTGRELRISSPGNPDGVELEPEGLIVHTPKIRAGTQIRGGLARSAIFSYLLNSLSLRQWAAFSEIYGIPLRLATYDPATMGPAEIAKIRRAIVSMGTDAAAIIPEGVDFKVLDARTPNNGENIFAGLAQYADSSISKIFLGQTLTTEKGASYAAANVHNEVRLDIARADARALFATERAQIAAPWTRYNHGETAPVPRVSVDISPAEDLKAFSDALAPLLNAGLRVSASEVRERLGLREPADGEELIVSANPAPDGGPSSSGASGSGSQMKVARRGSAKRR